MTSDVYSIFTSELRQTVGLLSSRQVCLKSLRVSRIALNLKVKWQKEKWGYKAVCRCFHGWICACLHVCVCVWPLCCFVPGCSLVQVAVRWQERLGGAGAERRSWAQLPGIKQWPLHNERWRQHFPLITRFHTVTRFAYSYIFPSTSPPLSSPQIIFSCEQDICLPDTALEEGK